MTEIGSFEFCDLKVLNIPDSVESIGGSAFSGCDRMEEIVLPLKLSKIPTCLFWGNDMLRKVTIQTGVEYIARDAFFICEALRDVDYTGTEAQWNQITIDKSNDDLRRVNIHFLGTDAPTEKH